MKRQFIKNAERRYYSKVVSCHLSVFSCPLLSTKDFVSVNIVVIAEADVAPCGSSVYQFIWLPFNHLYCTLYADVQLLFSDCLYTSLHVFLSVIDRERENNLNRVKDEFKMNLTDSIIIVIFFRFSIDIAIISLS